MKSRDPWVANASLTTEVDQFWRARPVVERSRSG